MKKQRLTMNELFSGIGAQRRGIDMTGLFNCNVVTTSDIDKDAIVSYAAVHNGLTREMVEEYKCNLSEEDMADYLIKRNIGYDFKKDKPYDWYRLARKKDKFDIKKYYLACKVSKNIGDISKVEGVPYADLWTYSYPCQDLSVAGNQKGMIEGKTRSGLLYEIERLLETTVTPPKYLLLENVKNLVGKRFKPDFDKWLGRLNELGYNTYWQVINGKNCGIPQNRERVFAISIRKDVDTGDFTFPEGFDNGLRLKDFLEDEVDEKFYISQEKTEKLISQLKNKIDTAIGVNVSKQAAVLDKETDIASTLLARDYEGFGNQSMTGLCIPCITPDREEKRQNGRRFKEDGEPMFTLTGQDRHGVLTESIRLGGIFDGETKHQAGAVWDKEGLCPTLDTMQEGYRQPSVIVKEATKQGYAEATVGDSINIQFPNSETRRGRVGKECAQTLKTSCNQAVLAPSNELKFIGGINDKDWVGDGKEFSRNYPQGNRVYDSEGIACSQTAQGGGIGSFTGLYATNYRIRKLTPRECWRLMGFTDQDIDKCYDLKMSDSQLYKQAGNSIITNCIMLLMVCLYKAQICEHLK